MAACFLNAIWRKDEQHTTIHPPVNVEPVERYIEFISEQMYGSGCHVPPTQLKLMKY